MTTIAGTCVEWPHYRNPKGYGQTKIGGRKGRAWLAHRWAWTQAHGPIPSGMCVLHRCDNPSCVNVDHLFLGTKADNNADMDAKGRRRSRSIPMPGEQHPSHKLTWAEVTEIRSSADSERSLAQQFGVSQSRISKIQRNEGWVV